MSHHDSIVEAEGTLAEAIGEHLTEYHILPVGNGQDVIETLVGRRSVLTLEALHQLSHELEPTPVDLDRWELGTPHLAFRR